MLSSCWNRGLDGRLPPEERRATWYGLLNLFNVGAPHPEVQVIFSDGCVLTMRMFVQTWFC